MAHKQLNLIVAAVSLIALVLVLSACGLQDSRVERTTDSRTVLRVGAIPVESVAKTRDQFDNFMAYLEVKTGCKVELQVAQEYKDIIEEMAKGNLDIAWFGPFSYIQARDKAGARAFAVEDNIHTGSVYHSVIIVHPESSITSLEQLSGCRIAFTDKSSTSGYLIPRAVLKKHGIDIEKGMVEFAFVNSHDAAILAVKKRTVDAAAVSDAVLRSLREKGVIGEMDYRVIYTSASIPGSVWAYREGLNPALIKAVKESFFSIAQEDKAALGTYGRDLVKGFLPVEDSSYDIIREAARQLEFDK